MWRLLGRLFSHQVPGAPAPATSEAASGRAREDLRRSEERFRLLVETVQDYAIFMLDPDGHVATWNAGAERIKGYQASEIIGKHFSVFYPAETVEKGWPAEELRRAAAQGRFEDEGWRVRKDGSRFWANVVITALRDASGRLTGFAKVTRDLTERRRAEQELRRAHDELEERVRARTAELARSNEALRAEVTQRQRAEAELQDERERLAITLASIGDAVIATDPESRITFMNAVAARLTGWDPSEAVGRRLIEIFRIVNEYTRQGVADPVAKVLASGVVCGLANHTILIARDGTERPIDDSAAPIQGDGQVRGVVLVFRDVTERRRANEVQSWLAAVVENSEDAIISKSLDGRITSWNRGAERLYGYTASEAIGQPISILVPSGQTDELTDILERIAEGERTEHYETVRRRKDGRLVDVSINISPVRDASGHVVGASAIARDITASKRTALALRQSEASLREADRQKDEFLAMLAHELRNPLAPIRNALQILRTPGAGPGVMEQAHRVAERQLRQLVRMVDDLLDVSRIMRGRVDLRKEPAELGAVLAAAVETAQPVLDAAGQDLVVSGPDEPVWLEADMPRLTQVVGNLLNNAAKFSPQAGRIWLSARRVGAQAEIRVRDEGAGIRPELLPRVFDLFVQDDRSLERTRGGLGIGLTVARQLVELHGGTITAESAGPGQGSEFVIRLPALAATPAQAVVAVPGPHTPSASKRLLVVDDNVDAAESVAILLRLWGHEVRLAHSGPQALEAAETYRPDLVLLDIGLPGMSGYDVARRLRAQPAFQQTVLAALTGYGQEADRRTAFDAGFDLHLTKPVDLNELERLVAGAVARRT